VRGLTASAFPAEWGPAPTIEQVRDAVFGVLAAHGRLLPDADPDPDAVGLLRSWAQQVLICGTGAEAQLEEPLADGEADIFSEEYEASRDRALAARGFVLFDARGVYDVGEYARVVAGFAAATGGDWGLGNSRSFPGEEPGTAVIEFEHDGRSERWGIKDAARKSVSTELYEYIDAFADAWLPGRFVPLPTGTQEAWFSYLPADLVRDLRRALSWPTADALVASIRAGTCDGRALREALNGLGLQPDPNTPAADGTLPVDEAIRLGLHGLARQLARPCWW
jgi:hypothetical protein